MKLAFPRQDQANETRTPVVPPVIKKLVGLGAEVLVESAIGTRANFADSAYHQGGATILTGNRSAWEQGDVVVTIHPPTPDQAGRMQEGAVLIGMLAPLREPELMHTLAKRGVTCFSLELLPRISRAQPMDVLSSQANIAGYIAAVLAAGACPKMFPMMITAAGTLAPSKVFVIGAGVAGLQAIATAKRLGAIVEAYDVRAVVKEQVQSVGGRFVELPTALGDAQTEGGYAKQQTQEQRQQQVDLMAKHVTGADAVITTAAVFGKDPPLLIPQTVVDQMKPGSVVVDLAADEQVGRGNCEATKAGQRYTNANGVTLEGTTNLPSLVPVHSSQMLANNVLAFLKQVVSDDGQLQLDLDDPIQKETLVAHQGRVVHPLLRQAKDQPS